MSDQIAENVLDRYLIAAMSDEKLNEILLRIRKGATSSLNWTQLAAVFAALDPGWKLEKIVGLVKLYGLPEKPDLTEDFRSDNRSEVEARYRATEQFSVTSLPSNPKAGQLYIMDLSPIAPYEGYGNKEAWQFEFRPWMGAEGWRITTPDGKVQDVLPGKYDLGSFYHGYRTKSRSKLPLYDIIPWLKKETDWLDQINKKLGMDAHEPAAPRTREGTGSCPVCFQNVKARPEIVLHGYKRPGWGSVVGNCFGMGFLPFEVSVKGTKAYLDERLEPQLKDAQQYLKQLKAGEIKQLKSRIRRNEIITPADAEWEGALERTIEDMDKRQIPQLEGLVGAYKRLVQHWKERPLPQQGDRHIDWFEKGQKP